ncbi:DUF885 domain-containing protein [Roseimaritima ulvae]|uniref:DUF885 domain-containing protein n=1 Tax=Roseimaritima ulvae TaxID=980254 RepID=A0A5B9QWY5_9BACT|nr:DUF885 domain-containing protein [Roseimaritima ulvae]QEG38463.1 hypothetical protein UC8_04200 [Roseimaritima ulvae]
MNRLNAVRTFFIWLGFATVLVLQPAGAQEPSPASEQLKNLLDEVWDAELVADPLLATDAGDARGQDRLPDDSVAAIESRAAQRADFLERLQAIDREALDQSGRVDWEVLRKRLQGQLDQIRFSAHLIPITNREGFHISFPELPRTMNPKTQQDFQNYNARLADFGRYADQQMTLMRLGMEQGRTLPAVVLREVQDQIAPHVVAEPADSMLFTPYTKPRPSGISEAVWQQLKQSAKQAIADSVVPGYQRFLEFMTDSYVPACRGSIAARALPGGQAYYANRVRWYTTLDDVTPEEVHQIGLNEVQRIRKEMEAVRESVKFEGDLDAFLQFLRTDPQFYATTPEQLLRHVAYILKAADGKLPEFFGKLPRTPYGIREVPAYVAPQTTSAYYWPPSADGKRAGFYYVNTYNLSARPLYQLESLSMHEAVPGHHLQLALQTEMTDLHPIRRYSDFTAFIEGWALYCEWLGKEMGFYSDPYQEFGRLSMEAWRACRLVVDTGIHHLGWTRQQAIAFMTENTALSRHNIIAEVDRYIAWPGQALGYKMGELKIRELRRTAEQRLGSDFDVRAFHDQVLAVGSIPLPLLEQRIEAWMEGEES